MTKTGSGFLYVAALIAAAVFFLFFREKIAAALSPPAAVTPIEQPAATVIQEGTEDVIAVTKPTHLQNIGFEMAGNTAGLNPDGTCRQSTTNPLDWYSMNPSGICQYHYEWPYCMNYDTREIYPKDEFYRMFPGKECGS